MSQVIIDALKNQLKLNHEHNAKIYDKAQDHLIAEAEKFKLDHFKSFENLLINISRDQIEFRLKDQSWSFLKYNHRDKNDWREEENNLDFSSVQVNYANKKEFDQNFTKINVFSICLELQKEDNLKNLLIRLRSEWKLFEPEFAETSKLEREISKLEGDFLEKQIDEMFFIGNKIVLPEGQEIRLTVNASWDPRVSELEIVSKTNKTVIVKFKPSQGGYEYNERTKIDNVRSFLKAVIRAPKTIKV